METLQIRPDESTPMSLQNDWLRVDWYNADEGLCGDYDPDDPQDINILRFDVYRRGDDSAWEEVPDASYATQVPADTELDILERALRYIFKQYEDALKDDRYASVKKLGEGLSWIGADSFRAPRRTGTSKGSEWTVIPPMWWGRNS